VELTETKAGKQFYTVTGGSKLEIEVTGYVWLGVYPGSVAKGKGLYNKTVTENDVRNAPVRLSYPLDQQLYVTQVARTASPSKSTACRSTTGTKRRRANSCSRRRRRTRAPRNKRFARYDSCQPEPSMEGFSFYKALASAIIVANSGNTERKIVAMASEYSFDIVSKVDFQEVNNAVTQAMKEIETRFDFKGSKSDIKLENEQLIVASDDDYKLKNVIDILQTKLIKRGVPILNLDYGKVEGASGGTVRQVIKMKQGIDQESAKKINILIRDSKLKVKSMIQGDQLRVTGKSKDDLQNVMGLLKGAGLPLELQFTNYR